MTHLVRVAAKHRSGEPVEFGAEVLQNISPAINNGLHQGREHADAAAEFFVHSDALGDGIEGGQRRKAHGHKQARGQDEPGRRQHGAGRLAVGDHGRA